MALQTGTRTNFERLALESAIREHPGDRLAQDVLRDWLREHGACEAVARRLVIQITREATQEWRVEKVQRAMVFQPAWTRTLHAALRARCSFPRTADLRVELLKRAEFPTWAPDRYYYAGPDGQRIENPADYIAADLAWTFVIQAVAVMVGAQWITQHCPPPGYACPHS